MFSSIQEMKLLNVEYEYLIYERPDRVLETLDSIVKDFRPFLVVRDKGNQYNFRLDAISSWGIMILQGMWHIPIRVYCEMKDFDKDKSKIRIVTKTRYEMFCTVRRNRDNFGYLG